MTPFVTGLRCVDCAHTDPVDGPEYVCSKCGGLRDVEYDYDRVAHALDARKLALSPWQDIRRYLPLLPVPEGAPLTPLNVGISPIYDAPRVARDLGVARVFIKDDGRLPTASFKDRASFVGTARAAHQGHQIVAAASTGNAATSVAGLGASMGLTIHIFVPSTAPEAKVAQLLAYGARVFLIEADYDATYDLCQEAVAKFGWYNRSAAVNPYLVEGKKTCGHELGEQLAANPPDWVSMSVGDGCSLAGTYKGLVEMFRIGVLSRIPRMLAVQAEGAAPLTRAFQAGTEVVERISARTVADSINVGMPRNPKKVLRAVRASNGAFVNVTDEAILSFIPRLARLTGVFGEPAGVTAAAGVEAARTAGIIGANESVACVISGNGLKDVKSVGRAVRTPTTVPANLAAVERALEAE